MAAASTVRRRHMQPNIFSLLRELSSAGAVALRVRGTCMTPHLAEGALLTVRAGLALPGDVLVFRTPAGDVAAHRLLGWRPSGFVTKGDRAIVHDAPVRRENVIGVADVAISPLDRLRALAAFSRIAWRKLTR